MLKILVAEDDTSIRESLRTALEEDGHQVIEAQDGLQGLRLVREESPRLIISDVRMPKMTGDRLFSAVRNLGVNYQVIPFIFLSESSKETEHIARMNNGADGCFRKPVNLKLLRAHVNSCLSNSQRHSLFIESKLNDLQRLIDKDSQVDFDHYQPLAGNVDDVLETIGRSVGSQLNTAANDASSSDRRTLSKHSEARTLAYVRYCLEQFDQRRALFSSGNADSLTWWMIFTVAEAQLAKTHMFVSDLYFSTPSAKTTINSRINLLVEEGILSRHEHPSDGRRQNLRLAESFQHRFDAYIGSSINSLRHLQS
ncbi:MAG: DNA-binding response OmpR family regulator/DNA-binding MarR family transcriptional regulator [Cyclobacteriaceae bacterium]|jgi:DNA-binding response OmpR family regulator/DNA-binding MarR family transcriptional regulator